MVSSKFYEDFYIDNETWSRIAGITLEEVNKLERKFLAYINFKINTQIECFLNYVQLILNYAVDNNITTPEDAQSMLQIIVALTLEEISDRNIE